MSKKVLFISHDASRTGAPIIFLDFLKWLRENTKIEFEILLRKGGELEPEFHDLANVHNTSEKFAISQSKALQKLLMPITLRLQWRKREKLIERVRSGEFNLIYSNTITNGDIVASLANKRCPVLTHVHELEYWIKNKVPEHALKNIISNTDHYIAVSHAVEATLINDLGININAIDVINGFVPRQRLSPTKTKKEILRELNIEGSPFIIGAVGTTDWRKGTDLFIQLAQVLKKMKSARDIHFVWVGGDSEGLKMAELKHDIKRIGMTNQIHFLGQKENPENYMNIFDVYSLVSREDPFPLVALEAAALGKPILAFEKGGGITEFIGKNNVGFISPYLDINDMAESICKLMDNPELKLKKGETAAKKIRDEHTIDYIAPKIIEVIDRTMKTN